MIRLIAEIHYKAVSIGFPFPPTQRTPITELLFFLSPVFKEPPYQLKESGYASFEIPIEVYFRNREEPKKISFEYDLFLDLGRPVTKLKREKLTFQNPSADFKKKLLKGGGVNVSAICIIRTPPPARSHE